jgi:1,4-alpha-glucan branching enzyme
MPSKSKQNVKTRYEDEHFIDTTQAVWGYSLLTADAVKDFQNGQNHALYYVLGSHHITVNDQAGYYFAVWAPYAQRVSVIGNFNHWNKEAHILAPRLDKSGIWEGFIPGLAVGELYKYHIISHSGISVDKGDPLANRWQKRPDTSSITSQLDYEWNDAAWMKKRKKHNALNAPWSVYELHLGSWRKPDKHDEHSFYNYRDIAHQLVEYNKETGFTHVELMPVTEYPYDGSWGYQCTGYFAPTARFGTPQDLMYMIDYLHQHDIGVIMDWVPSHFPYDTQGLFMFDGTHLYEYGDMRKGYHPDWNSYIFNYEKGEVKSFLISSARFWFELFHIDGMRVDAVSSMIYLNYSRKDGEWEPNKFGGDGNLEALDFVKDLNRTIYHDFPDVQMIAEEATNYQWVAKPLEEGGLGFGMKWMMGWMNDTLKYFKMDPLFRGDNRNIFTFSIMYAFNENYMLPLSHDEVVHGKSPMLYKMPGDEWQKFANLRLLYSYMWTHPGTKLLFMGNEFGQTGEWDHHTELNWPLLQFDCHKLLKNMIGRLNELYRTEPALYENQFNGYGFEWLHVGDISDPVLVYRRKGKLPKNDLVVVLNLAPIPRHDFELVVHGKAGWKEIFNSDHQQWWGAGDVYNPEIACELVKKKEKRYKIKLHVPPLGALILK